MMPYLLDFLDLLVEAANHVVGRVRNLLHHHQANERVHLSDEGVTRETLAPASSFHLQYMILLQGSAIHINAGLSLDLRLQAMQGYEKQYIMAAA